MKLQSNSWALENFERCLQLLNMAKDSGVEVASIFMERMPELQDGLTKFWSFKTLASNLERLKPEDHLEESFKLVGQLLEGVIKSYLRLLVHINRELRSLNVCKSNVDNLSFGALVSELKTTSELSELMAPAPWGLSLNQWRNIAYHHNAKLVNGEVHCSYGAGEKRKHIVLVKCELTELVRTVSIILHVFKNVDFVFFYDNTTTFKELVKPELSNDPAIRKEVLLVELFSGINSQGFSITDYSEEAGVSKLVLEELTEIEPLRRAIHSSQFLHSLWLYTRLPQLCVEYQTRGGKPYLISNVDGEVCRKVANGEKGFNYFSKMVQFERQSC